MQPKITIVDFASGNLDSIVKKLNDFGFKAEYTNSPEKIAEAKFLLMPGVGHFKTAMDNLRANGLIQVLNRKVGVDKVPIIGICLGMQLFTKRSDEGNVPGLGWIDAETKLFQFNQSIKVPHIGWNHIKAGQSLPFYPIEKLEHKYYFIHSYFVNCHNPQDIMFYTNYEGFEYCSAIHAKNIIGFQFHPEKSHKKGMQLLIMAIEELNKVYGS